MDLDNLKQQWKTNDMHPSIKFDRDDVKKAFTLHQREVKYAWILPVVLIIGLATGFYFGGMPDTITTKHYLLGTVILGLVGYSLFALWSYFRNTKTDQVTSHLSQLTRKNRWTEQLYGVIAIALTVYALIIIMYTDESWRSLAADSYLLWMYCIVFALMYYRKRRDRIAMDKSQSWQEHVLDKNEKMISRLRWLIPSAVVIELVLLAFYFWGYNSSYILGFIFGILFVIGNGIYEYLRRKGILDR